VLTALCDLEQDYNARRVDAPRDDPRLLPHVLLFDLYEESSLRHRFDTKQWRRVRQNQDERYHHLDAEMVGDLAEPEEPPAGERMGELAKDADEPPMEARADASTERLHVPAHLYIDFRRPLGISTEQIYLALAGKLIERVAIVPDVYVHDLIHRCYSYLSRVGIP